MAETLKPAKAGGAGMVPVLMVHVENYFEAPPDYSLTWLTDFRPDDGRLFGDNTPIEVVRNGNLITRRTVTPLGPMTQVVTIENARRWRVDGKQFSPDGTLLYAYTVVETVEPSGAGTRHTAEIVVHEAHKTMLPMLDEMKAGWNEKVRLIFSNVKPEIETAFKRGVAADA